MRGIERWLHPRFIGSGGNQKRVGGQETSEGKIGREEEIYFKYQWIWKHQEKKIWTYNWVTKNLNFRSRNNLFSKIDYKKDKIQNNTLHHVEGWYLEACLLYLRIKQFFSLGSILFNIILQELFKAIEF